MGGFISTSSKTPEIILQEMDPKTVIQTLKHYVYLLENQAATTVSSMETQHSVVEKLLEPFRTGPGEPYVDQAYQPRLERTQDIEGSLSAKPYLRSLLKTTQATESSQAYAMQLAVSTFKAFIVPVLERLEALLSHQGTPEQNTTRRTQEIEVLKSENSDLKKEVQKQRSEYDKLKKDNERLNREINIDKNRFREQTDKFEILSHKYTRQEVELNKSRAKINQLEEAVRRYEEVGRRQQSVSVQLYCTRKDDLVDKVLNELSRMMQTTFETQRTDVTTSSIHSVAEVKKDIPLVAICIQASRLGTDVDNGLKGLSSCISMNNVLCVVLHHKEIHTLPSQPSQSLLFSSSVKQLGAMIDMAFIRDKGMYPCEMNNRALDQLMTFIKTHPYNMQ